MSGIAAKRAGYADPPRRRTLALLTDWLVETAWAACPSGCSDPSHGHGGSSGSSEGRDDDGAAFAGLGLLAGVAHGQDKEWVSVGRVKIQAEPGTWKLALQVKDNKNGHHAFTVPFEMMSPAGEARVVMEEPAPGDREVAMLESIDADGNKTTIRLNPDGSRTVTVTDAGGKVVSTVTHPAADGARRTWLDPETGLRISEWTNADGSVTRRAEDGDGNWSEGTRYPGGKKEPASAPEGETPASTPAEEQPASTPQEETPPASTPEPESAPLPDDYGYGSGYDPGFPLPPIGWTSGWGGKVTGEYGDPGPGTATGGGGITQGDDGEPTVYGEEIEDLKLGILLERDDDTWLPTHGGITTVTASIYEMPAGGLLHHWRKSKQKRVITVRFVSVSDQPGQALNKKLDRDNERTPDLYLDAARNPDTSCTDDRGGMGYHFGSSVTLQPKDAHTFVVASEDFGSYALMEATAPGCVQLFRHDKGGFVYETSDPEQYRVKVPMDDNDNQIADGWLPDRVRNPKADTDDDDQPAGNGVAGDGYSAYEEYRGFFTEGVHRRTSLETKTLFIRNRDKLDTSKFIESRLEFYDIDHVEWDADERVVNYSHDHAHGVDQHGVLLESANLGQGTLGRTSHFLVPLLAGNMGPPKNVEHIRINTGAHLDFYGKIDQDELQSTVAHELGHACSVRHHGEGSLESKNVIKGGGTLDYLMEYLPFTDVRHTADKLCGMLLPRTLSFGAKHNQTSGQLDCIMRYNYWGDVYPQESGEFHCRGSEVTQTTYCEHNTGTGWNSGNRVAGTAARGNCRGQFQVNDK